MDKRKEQNFDPERLVDFVELIKNLDWSKEINPVMLVKTANKVAGLTGGKSMFKVNEVSFGNLTKSFEKRVSKFTDIRFAGKDRFYRIKPEFTVDQMVHYAKTGKIIEVKPKEEEKKDYEKYYTPEIPEAEIKEEITKRKKKVFPDDEALAKTAIIFIRLKEGGGETKTKEISDIMVSLGWKRQRAIGGKLKTIYQEANMVSTTLLDLEDPVEVQGRFTVKYKENLGDINNKIEDLESLMESEELKIVVESMKKPKPEPVVVEEPKVVEEVKKEPEPKVEEPVIVKEPKIEEEPKQKVIISSPATGTFKKVEETRQIPFENIKTRWNKSLIAEALYMNPATQRGTYYSFTDISQAIKRVRFVEIPSLEVKNLLQDVNRQKEFRGIFRNIDNRGITIGSESLVKDFNLMYDQSKITDQIYIRLKMSLDQIKEIYGNLQIEIASEISEYDNIYCITANRTEECERILAKLLFCMRPGEVVLESKSNWTIRRVEIIMEKLGLFNIC